jgi:hypothetical protein
VIIDRDDRAVFSEQLSNRRHRGRPRAVPTVATSVKLPEPVYDALCRHAQREGESLHATMRKALESYAHVPIGRGVLEFR